MNRIVTMWLDFGRGQLDLPGSEGVAAQRSAEAEVDDDAQARHRGPAPEDDQPAE